MNEEMEAELTKMDSRPEKWQYLKMQMLMKLYQFILENNKAQKHTKRQ